MVRHLKVDRQTTDDLGLFSERGNPSIYGLFNRTRTQGGAKQLDALFREPLTDAEAINKRTAIYSYFSESVYRFPIDAATVGTASHYLQNNDARNQLQMDKQSLFKRIKDMVATDVDVKFVEEGVVAVIRLHGALTKFLDKLNNPKLCTAYVDHYVRIRTLLSDSAFVDLRAYADVRDPKLSSQHLAKIDRQIRFIHREATLRLLNEFYELDVLIAVGQVAREREFTFARAQPRGNGVLRYKGVYHPHVEKAVSNNLEMNDDSRVLFLTGANMAGKSTLMKSLGIALYLAHMGFPVAAKELDFTVLDGIYTSINLSDDLTVGASHYYAEVLRVKEVAQSLRVGNHLLVIFDELFRGTNVKDAYDATIELTRTFSRYVGSRFVISTHIMEAGEKLQVESLPIDYQYLPTEMEGSIPRYTRILQEGITADRQGMLIIENEGILEMLDGGAPLNTRRSKIKTNSRPFIIDRQTLEDLNVLGKYKSGSLFNMFNRVKTRGGERMLEGLFRTPLTNADVINERAQIIQYVQSLQLTLELDARFPTQVEQYLAQGSVGSRLSTYLHTYWERGREMLYRSDGLQLERQYIRAVHEILLTGSDLLNQLEKKSIQENNPIVAIQQQLANIIRDRSLVRLKARYPYTIQQVAACRHLFLGKCRNQIEQLLQLLYTLDVYISVGDVARSRGLNYAEAVFDPQILIRATDLRHPALSGAVGNDIDLTTQKNLLFLTGANMAGKSTWMKTLGASCYLAHMGFPVASKKMIFGVLEGLFTSINVPDDIGQGWSHFYAEVMRVKHVARQVSNGKRVFVLFDELFKGTNVKDAYDATLAVTQRLAGYSHCPFVISTHIIEVGEALKIEPSIYFGYMPTVMEGTMPRYTYRMCEGVTEDRQGMMIIENEGILKLMEDVES